MPEPIIIALITVAGGLIGAWVTKLTGRKKMEADAAEVITEAASKAVVSLLIPLTERVKNLEDQLVIQRFKIERYGQRVLTLMRGIEKLIAQIAGLGHIPAWTPDEWDPDKET